MGPTLHARAWRGGTYRCHGDRLPDAGALLRLQNSDRVVADGEPVPKGGGSYRLGKPYNINGRTYVPSDNPSYRAEGVASWYGPDFHGRQTANGELYDMHAISAAHPTMPLPSYARVTNLDNGRSIMVRVNDRGPYVQPHHRLVDRHREGAELLRSRSRACPGRIVGRAPIEGSDDSSCSQPCARCAGACASR